MMSFESRGPLERCNVVVLGHFNPPIFYPEWFSRHGIMSGEEVEGLISEPKTKEIPEIGVKILYGQRFLVDNDQARINFQSLNFIVTRNKFEIRCEKRDHFPLLLKFLKKIFKLLPETPISAYGINFEEHFTFGATQEKLIGKFFTKNDALTKLFGDDAQYGYTVFANQADAKVTFQIRPSVRLEGGIYINVNFHYDNDTSDSDFLVNTVQKNFHEAVNFTEKVVAKNFGKVIERC